MDVIVPTLSLGCENCQFDLGTSPQAVLLAGVDGRLLGASQAAIDLLGTGPAVGAPTIAALLTAAGVDDAELQLAAARSSEQQIVIRCDGRERRVLLRGVVGAEGQVAYVLFPLACNLANEERRAAFQSTVAHELRSPLAAIQGYAGLLSTGMAGPLTDNQREFVAGIDLKIAELVGLLDAFLDYQRLEAGALMLHPADVDVGELLAQVSEEYADRARRQGVELRCDLPELEAVVQADPMRLRQIVESLLDNAMTYAGSGSWAQLGAVVLEETVELLVADGGAGVPEEQLQGLFDPYADERRGDRNPGAGLGLLVVKRLVASHGGRISVDSPAGCGLRFVVRLPRAVGISLA